MAVFIIIGFLFNRHEVRQCLDYPLVERDQIVKTWNQFEGLFERTVQKEPYS